MQWGVASAQLRIKNAPFSKRYAIYQKSIQLTRHSKLRLFINDDWQLAIELGAFGVHLGQSDLQTADLDALAKNHIRLGISTHSRQEVQDALFLNPYYIACGPVFTTQSKADASPVIGLQSLRDFRTLIVNCSMVAIGGIKDCNLQEVLATGVDGVCVIQALTSAKFPKEMAQHWYARCLAGRVGASNFPY